MRIEQRCRPWARDRADIIFRGRGFDEIAARCFIIEKLFEPAMTGRGVINDDIGHQPELFPNGGNIGPVAQIVAHIFIIADRKTVI